MAIKSGMKGINSLDAEMTLMHPLPLRARPLARITLAAALGLDRPATEGAVVASDAFFPFPDGLLAVADAGARAVIQPGGSMRDDAVIAAADAAGLAMVFTGMRHFRH